ncbi:MAG TPA: hypothetical protein VLM85_29045 [Polyangiaceae bacterium]|nr:hypothetical protein [Polyangiaceae bacterium]
MKPSERFQWFVCKMLLTFFTVAAVDLVALSLLTQKLRVWFPVWFDSQWATREHPWVVYSQSYFAGIFFIPLLAWAVDRDLLKSRVSVGARAAFWLVLIGTFAFILSWKGELMVRFGKQWEAAAWLALTTAIWTALSIAERLPRWLENMTPRRMARGLARGVATFFLVMAVLDPVLQIAVQKLGLSSGLLVEVGFFVPAGLFLMVVAYKLREGAEKAPPERSAVASRVAE